MLSKHELLDIRIVATLTLCRRLPPENSRSSGAVTHLDRSNTASSATSTMNVRP